MKKHWIVLPVVVLMTLISCGSAKMERSKDLIFVEQTDSVFGGEPLLQSILRSLRANHVNHRYPNSDIDGTRGARLSK